MPVSPVNLFQIKSSARSTRDADFGAVGDAHEQIAAPAAWPGQTFAGKTNHFAAGNLPGNCHAQKISRGATHGFKAAMQGALASNFQIAPQIRATHFESKIRSHFNFH